MGICHNCGAQLTCGCQQRTASDGTPTCQNCLADYEQQKAQQQRMAEQAQQVKLNNDMYLNS